ncbi:DUF402 domain-containing protein [Amphibacillus sp. MSJ-3]|uniref:nucleoside tri-diphosphate phosphatase n=1 Tax=Amphibacillus sp. MSJ-3 TaxID=2841505 RepID=UPI001C0EE2D5|nr:DUF402 domain-containing protein [Amphibacillus sp. MSJ-3]MBU5595647.1 DUF402 domain-containing protein [Amphibacillus sp. MSJ-3]
MAVPEEGSPIKIYSYKHNGQLHRIWQENVILKATSTRVIGANDRTQVMESNGRDWVTREPAICFFYSKHWFNVISMLREDGIHYYCNLSSPFVYESGAVKYIDYDLDIKVFPDMTYTLLDEDEYHLHRELMNYPQVLDQILRNNVDYLIQMIRQRKGPFSFEYVEQWYELFLTYRSY